MFLNVGHNRATQTSATVSLQRCKQRQQSGPPLGIPWTGIVLIAFTSTLEGHRYSQMFSGHFMPGYPMWLSSDYPINILQRRRRICAHRLIVSWSWLTIAVYSPQYVATLVTSCTCTSCDLGSCVQINVFCSFLKIQKMKFISFFVFLTLNVRLRLPKTLNIWVHVVWMPRILGKESERDWDWPILDRLFSGWQ